MNPYLEDADLLEMVNVGMIPLTVVDNHIGAVWEHVFDGITLHEDLAIRHSGEIAWAIRKNSPKLREVLDGFLRSHGKGTLFGNVLFKRYLKSLRYVRNPLLPQDVPKLQQSLALFRKYAVMYDFDWSMIAALAAVASSLRGIPFLLVI